MTWDYDTMDGDLGVPEKAVHLRNLAVACDTLMSSITHFYHLVAPSYIQGPAMPPWTPWFNDLDYNPLLRNPGGNTEIPNTDELSIELPLFNSGETIDGSTYDDYYLPMVLGNIDTDADDYPYLVAWTGRVTGTTDFETFAYKASDPTDRTTYVWYGRPTIDLQAMAGSRVATSFAAVLDGTTYKLFATCEVGTLDNDGSMHVYTSPDGLVWTYDAQIYDGTGSVGIATRPTVVKVDSTFHIWAQTDGDPPTIAYASWDGTTFSNPVELSGLGGGGAYSPSAYATADGFTMYLNLGGQIRRITLDADDPCVVEDTSDVLVPSADDRRYRYIDASPTWLMYVVYDPTDETNGDVVARKVGAFSADLWSAVITQYVKALRIRRLIFEASALFIGRAPMTSHLVAGGVTCNADDTDFEDRCDKFKEIMKEVAEFIAKEYVPVTLALGALYAGYDNPNNSALYDSSGLKDVFDDAGWEVDCEGWGAGLGQFLAWGNYPTPGGGIAVKGGCVDDVEDTKDGGAGTGVDLFMEGHDNLDDAIDRVKAGLREFITYSRYADDEGEYTDNESYPGDVQVTQPDRDKANAYTYMKAPRFDGMAREVGPMARLYVNSIFKYNNALADTVTLGEPYVGYVDYAALNSSEEIIGIKASMVSFDLINALAKTGVAAIDENGVLTGPIIDWILGLKAGISTMDRIRARALEALIHIQFVNGPVGAWTGGWIDDVKALNGGDTYIVKPVPAGEKHGFGCIEAARGALAHFSTTNNGKITAYQCVVPYTWNGSPRDEDGNPGATEAALVGVPFDNNQPVYLPVGKEDTSGNYVSTAGGIEVLRVAQSFDPCVACAIH